MMQCKEVPTLTDRKKADVLFVPCYHKEGRAVLATEVGTLKHALELPLRLGDFQGKAGDTLLVYLSEMPEARAVLVGLGNEAELSAETLRLGYGKATPFCRKVKAKNANVLLPHGAGPGVLRGAGEGLFVSNYAFNDLKGTGQNEAPVLLEKVTFVGADEALMRVFKRAATVADSISFARDLVNANADDLYPEALATKARDLGKEHHGLKVTTFDKKRIEKEGMGLLLAVNKSSPHDPAFIIVQHQGNPKSTDHTVIVGKGITYDTGGLDLKPKAGMYTMKTDMAAAAACLATLRAVAMLNLPVNVTAVVPSTENCIGGGSYKPGDVYQSYLGKTVEIGDTDAEGRLALADALAYSAKHLAPTRMIDLATLTGSIVMGLGEEIAGLMSDHDELAESLLVAGRVSGDHLWRMPLVKSYRKLLDSDLADVRNIGSRAGGAIQAGLFLKEFVGETPWAHMDIAGTGYTDAPLGYQPARATGFGVRLLVEYLEQLSA